MWRQTGTLPILQTLLNMTAFVNRKTRTAYTVMAWRLARLLAWLLRTALRLRRLDGADDATRRRVLQQMGEECLHIMAVRVDNPAAPVVADGTLLVANHVSWLDIFVLVSVYPCRFIAMTELQRWPFIGKMIRNAGAVFIDRSSRKDIDPINAAIAQALRSGGNVCFFPEARTSLGNGVLPLKAALFQAAIQADAPIRAAALRYYDAAGQRTEAVSFADINLFVSLWRILRLREIVVRVDFADTMRPEGDRFAIKDCVEAYLRQQVLSDSPNPQRLLP